MDQIHISNLQRSISCLHFKSTSINFAKLDASCAAFATQMHVQERFARAPFSNMAAVRDSIRNSYAPSQTRSN